MIPLSLFNERSVIEFGCNSGENALYLAYLGARLTLVEPNGQVLPRLESLFEKFRLREAIDSIQNKDIAAFESRDLYDMAIAECFINQLSNSDSMFLKICSFVKPGGLGVISFDDVHGSFLEMARQLVHIRACRLEGIDNVHSNASLCLARRIYGDDFARLSASRPFEAWWKDVLVSPFVDWDHLWEFQRFINLLDKADCEFYSSSPKWAFIDTRIWYKNVLSRKERHRLLREDWYRAFPYFITGLNPNDAKMEPADSKLADTVSGLIKQISVYVASDRLSADSVSYPSRLDHYLSCSGNAELKTFNSEMKRLFEAIESLKTKDLISAYHDAKLIRKLWGVPCQYISFIKRRADSEV
jgi:SAM-dependent methyltransferase